MSNGDGGRIVSEPSTWIKLDRNIMQWEWYTNSNTMRVFVHLLLRANAKEGRFKGLAVGRGQLITSYQKIALETGISVSCVRKAVENLKRTGELTSRPFHDFSLITIKNYDRYQDTATNQSQAASKQSAPKKQQPKARKKNEVKKEDNPVKEPPNEYVPQYWELPLDRKYWGRFTTEDEYYDYRQNGGE